MTVILMYHALYKDNADLERIDTEDRPYAVSADQFRAQLALLQDMNTGVSTSYSSDSQPDVVVTFDDGHVSNYDIGLPMLAELGLNAYFFITTDYVGNRPHFCSSAQLRDMHTAGMIIGSHGKTHGFFADMQNHEADHEFRVSRDTLADMIGGPVESISFPGGRYLKSQLGQARGAGYKQIFGSGFGLADFGRKAGDGAISDVAINDVAINDVVFNRIPVRSSTTLDEFKKIITTDRGYYLKEGAKRKSKDMLKRILGNQRYHALYKYAAERR